MCYEKLSDQELVSSYIRGAEKALEVLINRHKGKIFGYIMSLVKDSQLADDIFQDVFIKVIHTVKGGRYNEEGKFLPWVMRISHNQVIDTFRKAKRAPISSQSEDFDLFDRLASEEKSAEDKLVWEQLSSELRDLVGELPDDQRIVLHKRIFCKLSFKEIAEETDVSINTALGRMRYALINMRRLVEEKQLNLRIH